MLYKYTKYIPYFMPIGLLFINCLSIIISLDLNSFLYNLNTVSLFDESFDSSLNYGYDPVKDAAARNAAEGAGRNAAEIAAQNAASGRSSTQTNSSGGGPSQPEGRENPSVHGTDYIGDTDTRRLADYLNYECGRGNSVENCGLRDHRMQSTTPQKLYLSRIWAHVKAEHPEIADNFGEGVETTVINDALIKNIKNLNKNYPGTWP
jgi:hypothetical protein